ncbi:hypothetical protein LR48_Vigan07g283900 [Vigna angularis]|uniref:Pectinesterase inhibitor domain-containing protein n=1 Tax=Phaseolus angularis TaxID=3914 RepID=A0A0L9V1Y3_PHAAN|nr:hypothetical protein LR48_Vigan07g283900 [Vigna angularis]
MGRVVCMWFPNNANLIESTCKRTPNPKFAEDGANDAANEATFCESDFSGNSPLTKQNNAMHDVTAITAAIVRLLL